MANFGPNMLFKSFWIAHKEGDMITPEEFDEFDLDTVPQN